MYDPKTGTFYYGDTEFGKIGLLQFESAYYLNFNAQKALYAIEQLKKQYEGTSLSDKCFHYHIYIDLLFQAVGLIYNRFVRTNDAPADVLKLQQLNCQQYEFNEINYPLLHNKAFRNFIEHIDERDERLAERNSFFGTFNMIFDGMDTSIRQGLLRNDKPQNNLLNLEEMSYTILESKNDNLIQNTISIIELENELNRILATSARIWDYLTNGRF